MRAWTALAVLAGVCAAFSGACDVDTSVPPTSGCSDCGPDATAPQRDARPDPDLDADTEDDAALERCAEGASEACYEGPSETADHDPCRSGLRMCTAGEWSACEDQVLPRPERCNAIDDDCDGAADETFDLEQDEDHCGACNRACAVGETCCGGGCVDVQDDDQHCGGCGIACDSDRQCCDGMCADTQNDAQHCGPSCVRCADGQGCCSGTCVSLSSFQHCGSCGNTCDAAQLCCGGQCMPGPLCGP